AEEITMADTHAHSEHHGAPSTRPYLVIFYALCVFTAASFLVNWAVRNERLTSQIGFLLILGVAVCKALLVATYFMHLKWDWGRLYILIIPAMVLAPMLVFALLPDIVLYWFHVAGPPPK